MKITKRESFKVPIPGEPVVSKQLMQKRLARQAAIEGQLARYITLECGHLTTIETHNKYLEWQPRKKRRYSMCEQCEDWVKIQPPPRPPVYPDTPLF